MNTKMMIQCQGGSLRWSALSILVSYRDRNGNRRWLASYLPLKWNWREGNRWK
ncbi:hypothetical protein ANCCAN_10137 [Ancylostoma caninum]|uniref:Uncharacterized protein n=1 Tax=Ancylostoma caninum TaxID=29170 RepID=A0A368GLL2_ANCCA|nr:hypothetical protein ANCCAN_10137 [Ancylostoma caninum]